MAMLSITIPLLPSHTLLSKDRFSGAWIADSIRYFTDPATGLLYSMRPNGAFAERIWTGLQKKKTLDVLAYPENLQVWCQSVSDKQLQELRQLPAQLSEAESTRLTERHNRNLRTVIDAGKNALFTGTAVFVSESLPASPETVT